MLRHAALAFVVSCLPVSAAPKIGLWSDDTVPNPPVAELAALRQVITDAGAEVVDLSTADLADPAELNPQRLAAVILPYGDLFPVAARPALDAYLKGRGAYLALGAPTFGRLLYQAGERWVEAGTAGETVWSATGPRTWLTGHQSETDTLTVAGEGTVAKPYHAALVLTAYAYAGLKLPALPADGAVVTCQVRGDVPRLAVEIRETDHSRWKQIVEVTPDWQTVSLHLGQFASYASEGRGTPGDYLHGERVADLWLGAPATMVGKGEHWFEVRDLKCCASPLSSAQVAATGLAPGKLGQLREWFGGDQIKVPDTLWPSCFSDVVPVTGTMLRPVKHGVRFSNAKEAPAETAGWRVDGPVPPAVKDARRTLFPHAGKRLLEVSGWWELAARDGSVAPVGAVVTHTAGPYAGSLWAALGIADLSAGSPHWQAVRSDLVNLLSYFAAGVAVPSPQPAFEVVDGVARVSFRQPLLARGGAAPTFSAKLESGGRLVAHDNVTPTLDGSNSADPGLLRASLTDLDLRDWALTETMVDADGEVKLTYTVGVDANGALRQLAERLVARGASNDAKFNDYAFVDNRGARALLGAYELFGAERYREAALNWGRMVLAEQRPDGGYRMGYGITKKGEECYVADGGEIAVGIAALVGYTEGTERQRFLDSLNQYGEYRESFRVATGGIGVGWCLSDYGKRPIVPLDEPTRIYSPENNTYTIGCTLGAAYAQAHLRNDAKLQARAAADADWLMERAEKITGQFAESYFFAHALTTDAKQRQVYTDYLTQAFATPIATNPTRWWITSQGRGAMSFDSLVYYRARVADTPELLVQEARASYAILDWSSDTSLRRLLTQSELTWPEWLYTCFAGLGLSDFVQPMVSLEGFGKG